MVYAVLPIIRNLFAKTYTEASYDMLPVIVMSSGVNIYDWCHPGRQLTVSPLFFHKKTCDLFQSSLQSDDLFSCRLVTTPRLPSSDIVLSSVLCKFSRNFFKFGCHALDGVTRSGPPSDATGNVDPFSVIIYAIRCSPVQYNIIISS